MLFLFLFLLVAGVAVVLVLGFAVGSKWFVGGGERPEATVEKFFEAMEKGDAKAMVSLVEPGQLQKMNRQIRGYYDSLEDFFRDYLRQAFPGRDLEITGLVLESRVTGNTAEVTVVEGTATYSDAYGEKITERVDDPYRVFYETEYDLRKVDGTWYLMLEIGLPDT